MAREAAADNEADCSDVTIRFDPGEAEPYCYAGKSTGRDGGGAALNWSVDWQLMAADENYISRAVEIGIGNRWTYIEVIPVIAQMESWGGFTSVKSWGEPYQLDGYQVARFFALWSGLNASWHCAGFTRYAVPAGRGYREALRGYICAAAQIDIDDETLRDFLRSIRD